MSWSRGDDPGPQEERLDMRSIHGTRGVAAACALALVLAPSLSGAEGKQEALTSEAGIGAAIRRRGNR